MITRIKIYQYFIKKCKICRKSRQTPGSGSGELV